MAASRGISSVRRLAAAVLLGAFFVCPWTALAEEADAEWKPDPPPPMPEKWDWVQMTSGEWLKGELKFLYDETVEFDSDEFGVLNLDWGDISQIRTAQVVAIRFLGDTTAVGRIFMQGDTIRVMGDEDRTFERSRVLTVVAGEPKEINYWTFKLTAGVSLREGNTEQVEANSRVRINRRTVKNRISLEYLANYNQTDGDEVANNQRATAGWNRYINQRFYVSPVFLEYFRDPFQNISQRWTYGAGVGYSLMDTKKIDWEVFGGPAYQKTYFESFAPEEEDSESTPALVGGTMLDVEVTSFLDWDYEYRFQIVNEASGKYNHHMVTGLDFELTSVLDFNVTFVWDRIENPRPSEDGTVPESDDYRLNVGLTLDF